MGLAWRYLNKHRNQKLVALANCGTGGMKVQVYTSLPSKSSSVSRFRVALFAEIKPTANRTCFVSVCVSLCLFEFANFD